MKKIFTFLMVCLVGVLGVFGLTSCGGYKENYDEYVKTEFTITPLTKMLFTCGEKGMSETETNSKTKLGFVFSTPNDEEIKAVEFNGEIVELERKDKDVSKISGNGVYYETKKEFQASKTFFEGKEATAVYFINAEKNKVYGDLGVKPITNFYDIDTWLSFFK